jgi:hypothetical protein
MVVLRVVTTGAHSNDSASTFRAKPQQKIATRAKNGRHVPRIFTDEHGLCPYAFLRVVRVGLWLTPCGRMPS